MPAINSEAKGGCRMRYQFEFVTRLREFISLCDELAKMVKRIPIWAFCNVLGCAAIVAIATLPAREAAAQSQQQTEWCRNRGNAFPPDQVIAGCTAGIESGRWSGKELAVAYNNRGGARNMNGDFDDAIEDFDEAIRLDPKYALAFNNRGSAWIGMGDFDHAIGDFNQAIALDPKYALAYNHRGTAWIAKGDLDRAIGDFNEAIRLEPKYAPAYNNRGGAWMAKGDFERSISDHSEAIRFDANYALAYLDRGIAALYSSSPDKAIADLNRASELDAKNPYAALWLDIANKRSNVASRLAQASTQIDMSKWPGPLVRLFLAQLTPDAVLAAADDFDANTKRDQVCEANFYTGQLALRQGTKEEAARLFRLAAVDCRKDFAEWAAANAELKTLGAAP
jgi:lipoprotein NlpI